MLTLVLGISTLLQFIAAGLALRLIWVTRRRAGWILIASAVLLMAVRRSITLSKLLLDPVPPDRQLTAELVALLISVLMLAGISFIAPYFRQVLESTARSEQSEQRLQAIVDNTMAVVYVKDAEGRFVLINQKFEQILGVQREDAIGKTDQDLFPAEVAHEFRRNDLEVLANGVPIQVEEHLVDVEGVRRSFISLKFPLVHPGHPGPALCGISTEITERLRDEAERRELERRILHKQKLESLGVLAGGIAHDFNNLLVPILATADLLSESSEPGTSGDADLGNILDAAHRAADLCNQLLAYSGRGRFQVEAVDLSELVSETVDLLHFTVQGAAVEYDLAADLPPVAVDATQLRQVVMNLVTNAAEAIDGAPNKIRITTGAEHVAPGDRSTASGGPHGALLSPGEYVFFEVADTGKGMDPVTCGRIFEPFFTTKFTGRGLGLAAVLGIVKGHAGAIRIESRLDEGTTLRVLLPATRQDEALAEPEASASLIGPVTGTVLVVDDEEPVRRTAQLILEAAGLDVLLAANADEALELHGEHGPNIDCVLVDLTMPGGNGIEVASAIRSSDPAMHIVLMSGYDESSLDLETNGGRDFEFLQKPFLGSELLELVTRSSSIRPQTQQHPSRQA